MINMITMKLFIEITSVIYDLIPRLWPDLALLGPPRKMTSSQTSRWQGGGRIVWEPCLLTAPNRFGLSQCSFWPQY